MAELSEYNFSPDEEQHYVREVFGKVYKNYLAKLYTTGFSEFCKLHDLFPDKE